MSSHTGIGKKKKKQKKKLKRILSGIPNRSVPRVPGTRKFLESCAFSHHGQQQNT